MSRPSLVSVVVAVAITTGVSCAGAESDELSAQSKPLTGVALVTINPKGYKGPICVGSLGCTPPTGLSRAYDLAAGTYALSASYTVGLDAETSALGTMTVSASGGVTLDSLSLLSLSTPVTSGVNTTIEARVVNVLIDKSGYTGHIGLAGGVAGLDPIIPATLLFARRYRLGSLYSRGLDGTQSNFSTKNDLRVDASGALSLSEEGARKSFFDPVGTVLKIRTYPVLLDRNGYIGSISIGGIGGFDTTGTVMLMANRSYRLASSYSLDAVRQDNSLSSADDLSVKDDGTVAFIGQEILSSVFPLVAGNTIKLRTMQLTIDRNGYIGSASIAQLGGFDANNQITLMLSRRYRLASSYSRSISRGDDAISATNDLLVDENANVSFVGSEILKNFFPVTGATIKIRTAKVRLDRNGSLGSVSVVQLGGFTGPDNEIGLMVARRYRLVSSYSENLTRSDSYFTGGDELQIDENGVATFIGSPEVEKSLFPPVANTIKIKTTTLTLNSAGFGISVAQLGGFTAGSVTLMKHRRYRFGLGFTVDIVRNDSNFSTAYDISLDENGIVQVGPESATAIEKTGDTSLAMKVATVRYDRAGYPGQLSLPGVMAIPDSGYATLIRSRRYRLYGTSSLDASRSEAHFTTGYDLGIDANGALSIAPLTNYFTASVVGGVQTLTPKRKYLTVTRPAGYTGAIGVSALSSVTTGDYGAYLIPGRRYTMLPGNVLVTLPLNDNNCSPNPYVSGGYSFTVACSDNLPPVTPPPPSGFGVSAISGSRLQLSWADMSAGTANVRVERSTVPGPTYDWQFLAEVPAGTTTFTNQGLSPSTTYHYRIGSVDATYPNPVAWVGPKSATTLTACTGDSAGTSCGGTPCAPLVCGVGSSGAMACLAGTPLPAGAACGGETCNPMQCTAMGACVASTPPSGCNTVPPTPPPGCATPAPAANLVVPSGVAGVLAFTLQSTTATSPTNHGFGLVRRSPAGDPTYIELLDTSKRGLGDVFYKTTVTGGETFELYLQANKGAADTAITPAIYSSDPSKNLLADCSTPGHLAAPLQDMQQQQTNTWSIRWEAPHSSNSSYNADYNDLVVLAQVQAPCNPAQGTCQPPEALVSAHTGGAIDNLNDGAFSGLAGASIPVASFGDPTGGEGSTVPLGLSTVLGGRVDNVRWSFVQEGVDFSLTPPTNGSGLLSGGFDVLEVRRIHRPRAEGWTSSFGPGVFSPFDAKLAIRPSAIGSQSRIEFFDPSSDAPPIIFSELSAQDGDAVVDGRYRDQTRTYASLTLLNASSTVVADTSLATRAVVSRFSGEKLVFDIIDTHTGGAPALYGRLTAAEDRSGNATTVQYVHPADASDSQLSGDRSRLWLMQSLTDMHGASASFAYQFRSGSSRWVVQTVTPPAGGAIQYQYGNDSGNLDRLTGVNYPNGDASEFSRTWDAPSNTWALSLKDASGEGVRAWKTVYLTPASFTGAGGVLRRQEPNLVKRITNASGQTVHELQEDPNDARVTYVRQGSGRLFRMKVDNLGVPAETAVATSSPSNPLAASFVVQESYGTNAFGMIERAIDALGKTRVFTRHPNTGALTGLSARDGTTATLVTNDVGQVSRTIDRAGRVNDFLYDEKGRAKTLTRAAGTGDIGVWTYEYNSRGQVVKATDANNHVTDYAYDPQGRLLTITLPADLPGGVRPVTTFEYYPSGQLHASTDADARRTEYEYDSRGRLALTRYPDLTTETITYGTGAFVGLVESTTNRKGIITTFEYDTSHRLTKTTNAAGRPEASTTTLTYVPGTELVATQTTDGNRAEFTYDSSGRQISRRVYTDATHSLLSTKAWDAANDRVVAETDPYGRRVHFAYDSAGRLVRTVRELVPQGVPAGANISALARITTPNPAYVIEESIYDGRNQVVETVDARGTRTVNTYDQQGRLEAVTEAAGTSLARPRSFEYDAAGNMVAEIRPRLNAQGQVLKTSHTYTQRNLRLSSTEAAGTSLAATTSYTYTLSGATKTVTDPRGAVTTSNYDVNGRLGSTVDALQKTTSYTYDAVGNRLTTSNALGTVLTSTYDGLNRVLTETNALNETTTYTYDDDLTDGAGLDDIYSNLGSLGLGTNAPGRAVRTTNAMSESRLEVSDGAGRPILAVDAAGKETRQTYDVVIGGLLESSVVSPSGATTKTRADGAGRARTSVDPAGFQTVRTFDAGGNQKSVRDPNNVGEDCSFDVLGRRTSCVDTQGDSTGWEYDTENNQTASIDGRQVRSTCAFDGRNRKASCTDGIGATTTWAYDANSNITDITDAEGKVTHYEYNLRNQRTETKYADSSGPNDKVVVTYDDVGRLHTSTDQAGNTKTFIYNNANRLLERRYPDQDHDTFTYDAVGRLRTANSARYGNLVEKTYDSAGRPKDEKLTVHNRTYTVTRGYDSAGREATLTYPDGSVVTRGFNNRDLVASISAGATSIAQFSYDAGGRVGTTTYGNGLVETKTYRNDDRVSEIAAGAAGNFTYTFDAAKRKTSEGGSAVNGVQTFGYDNEARLTSWSRPGANQTWVLSPVGDWQSTSTDLWTQTRSHNAAHELTNINGDGLSYDERGNLTGDDLANEFEWDFDNRLVRFVGSSVSVDYAYDALGRLVARSSAEQLTIFIHASDEVIAEYGNGGAWRRNSYLGLQTDQVLALKLPEGIFWMTAGHLASLGSLTDASGDVVERYRYDAYGARTVIGPTGDLRNGSYFGNRVGFTGRWHDESTALVNHRARFYDPRLGRFLSRDDAPYDGPNLYAAYFVPNHTDPSGHIAIDYQQIGRINSTVRANIASTLVGVRNDGLGRRGTAGIVFKTVGADTTRSTSSSGSTTGCTFQGSSVGSWYTNADGRACYSESETWSCPGKSVTEVVEYCQGDDNWGISNPFGPTPVSRVRGGGGGGPRFTPNNPPPKAPPPPPTKQCPSRKDGGMAPTMGMGAAGATMTMGDAAAAARFRAFVQGAGRALSRAAGILSLITLESDRASDAPLEMAGDGTPRSNRAQNKQVTDAIQAAERITGRTLTPEERKEVREKVHREISGQGLGWDEVVAVAVDVINGCY